MRNDKTLAIDTMQCKLLRDWWHAKTYYVIWLLFTRIRLKTLFFISERQEFCHNEEFTAGCDDNQVVVMTLAQYGRMALSRCVTKDYGYIGCGADVINIAHAFCSGRRTCTIPVPNELFDIDPECPDDFKSYFRASYECQQGMQLYIYTPTNIWHIRAYICVCMELCI